MPISRWYSKRYWCPEDWRPLWKYFGEKQKNKTISNSINKMHSNPMCKVKNSLLERTSVVFESFVILGIMAVSTFSNTKMLVMQDVMDSANPNHPINSPVVYKSKQKNFRTMINFRWFFFVWFQLRRVRLFTLTLDELINATIMNNFYYYWNEHFWHRKNNQL